MMTAKSSPPARRRSGITLTEILIAILIMGVGLVSLATLFPIGLLRLRDAARYSRSSYLGQSAAADVISRSLLSNSSFAVMDFLNTAAGVNNWYTSATSLYNPFVQDTPSYGGDWPGGAYAGLGGTGAPPFTQPIVNGINALNNQPNDPPINGPGLPFAYDPLWRYQTVNANNTQANGAGLPAGGYYPFDPPGAAANFAFEARFGSGIGFLRNDLDGNPPSAYGLQRISNFNRPSIMAASQAVPTIFVSPEDVVWQDATNQNYLIAGNVVSIASNTATPGVGGAPSPVLPDLSIAPFQPVNDYRYSWIVTAQLTNATNEAVFDGNVVIYENRSFAISSVTGPYGATYQVDGETVVEAIFGHGGNINGGGYATGADRTVLLRWEASLPDPVVKAGDWIADVTYERVLATVQTRWWGTNVPVGVANPSNNGEWDNLPAQRCIWYQVQKVLPAGPDPYGVGANPLRSMVVYVNQPLQSKTRLSAAGTPVVMNAALIAPQVVNVIPQTFFAR
jgi:hypothetical protein